MILRLLRGRLRPEHTPAFTARLAEVLRSTASGAGMIGWVASLRDEGDSLTFLALSTWTDLAAIEAATAGRAGPSVAFEPLTDFVEFDTPEHFELVGAGDGSIDVRGHAHTIGLLRARFVEGSEHEAMAMIRRQQDALLRTPDVASLFVGRRLDARAEEVCAAALWHDRDRMRAFLADRPEGPGVDRRFAELTTRLQFETFEVFDAASPAVDVGVPAVLVLDALRTIVDASTGVERFLGVPGELLLGRRLDEIVIESQRRDLEDRWLTLLGNREQEAIVETETRNGGRRLLRHRMFPNVPTAGLFSILVQPLDAPAPPHVERTIRRALGGWRPLRVERRRSDPRLPRLVTVPSSDRVFHRFVKLALESLGVPSMRRLQLHLRGLFPQAVVHRRELDGERGETWYVFRDGRMRRSPLGHEWWRASGLASAAIDERGIVVEVGPTSGSVLGFGPQDLLGRDLKSFALPGSGPDLALIIQLAFEAGGIDTVFRIAGPTGPLDLAFHGERTGGVMRYVTVPLPPDDASPEWFAPICLPAWDDAFIARVEDLCARLAPHDAAELAEELAVRLRTDHPNAVVRPLGPVLGFGSRTHVLLVYRDGEQSPYADEAWWEDPACASVTIVNDRYADCNEAALRLHGVSREEFLSSSVGRFELSGEDRTFLSDILHRTGTLHTTGRLTRADGRVVEVEYRAVVDPHEQDRIELRLRLPAAERRGGAGATTPRRAARRPTGEPA